MKRDAEANWAAERVENALLRERINDIATEVTKLAVVLEGPDSPIDTILADAPRAAGNGQTVTAETAKVETAKSRTVRAKTQTPPPDPEPAGSLADRMRALQSRASRLSPAS
jgi:hypothetical protein